MTIEETIRATINNTIVIGEAIRDLGSVPSGHLYAILMSKMDLETYLFHIAALKRANLVSESNHLLTWIGEKPKNN